MAFNMFNCEKTKVVLQGKCKNMMLSRCKKVHVTVDEMISTLEIIKSEDVKVFVEKKCPMIAVELTQGVVVTATEASKKFINIMTTASQSVSMVIPKTAGTFDPNDDEDDQSKQLVVPESFLSKINDKLSDAAYDFFAFHSHTGPGVVKNLKSGSKISYFYFVNKI